MRYKTLTIGCVASLCFGAANAMAAEGKALVAKPPAKNSYSLEVKALQDVNNLTDVYVTVKPVSTDTSPAGLAKHVQMKSFDTTGELRWTKNAFDIPLTADAANANSTAQFSYSDMGRFQPVQAQVQVQTDQTTNTEVLKTKVPVLYRPDLTVSDIQTKETVNVGEVVNIAATIKELNGDLGANAKVALKKELEELDKVENVNIAANGNVGIVFSTLFTEPGTYTLTVSVDNPNPGDYDTSNNQKEFTVTVVNNAQAVSVPYSMSYHHHNEDYSQTWSGWWGNGINTWKGEYQGQSGYLDLTGHAQNITYPLKATLNFRADNNSENLISKSVSNVHPDWTWSWDCYSGKAAWRDLGDNVYFYASSGDYCGSSWANASYSQHANDYVYFSEYHDYYWGSHYTNAGTVKNGTFIRAQQSVQTQFVIETATGQAYGGNMEIPSLQKNEWDYPFSYNWYDYQSTGWTKGYNLWGSNWGNTTQP